MLQILLSIIGILFTILFIIGTHEAAHFGMARLLGVKVLCFSIGFGKRLFGWRDRSGTEYIFSAIPLGGYVRMLDEGEGIVPKAELHQAFNRQPYYKKFLIVAAGPLCNLFCAFLLYWLIFMIGFTTIAPIIGKVTPDSIADKSGLKTNQEIISIDNSPATNWMSIMFRLLSHTGNHDTMVMQVRDRQTQKTETRVIDLSNWQMDSLSPDPLRSLGIAPYEPNIPLVIGAMAPGSPALASKLQLNDKIVAINQQKVSQWDEVTNIIAEHPNQTLQFEIERQGKNIIIPVTLSSKSSLFDSRGYLGIGPNFTWSKDLLRLVQYNPIAAIPRAWQQLSDFTYLNLMLFGKLFTGKLSLQSLGGPITIFETAGTALNSGYISFLSYLAFLSISIGVINIFPIPGLDGGHLFLQTIEWIIRRPLPDKLIEMLYKSGIIIILLFLTIALVNDIMRL